ncbi:fermentation-respiration switch protein FrsA (DUF1100 family) [Cytobacillus eiseniae]|uniref:Fermentation-respiration switch protein FrsA (DUF1100 family) n=1 Tax=Cytobacillus eiseniae TaxID=762947 RepID=A0ABS4RE01_9BACI|nr:fermentation-respiration switch protein FrsA (DUF1100 family) [Cytobacillus eiseniae]
MIGIEKKNINDIPLLHIVAANKKDEKLPLIMFVHGFKSIKEKNLHYAYFLAEKGYRVILPEALHHGGRSDGISGNQMMYQFWDIILQTISELEIIKNSLEKEHLIDASRIGLVGTSMGGMITLGALTKYPWIKAATCLMGMPYYEKFAQLQLDEMRKNGLEIPLAEDKIAFLMDKLKSFDLSMQTEKLAGRPLLFWHGEKDPVVPFEYTYHFYETIKPLYEQQPEKLKFIVDEKAGHKVSNEGISQTVRWFELYV